MQFIKKNDLNFIKKPADLEDLKSRIKSKIINQEQYSFKHLTDKTVWLALYSYYIFNFVFFF